MSQLFDTIWQSLPALLEGAKLTLLITAISAALGMIGGSLIGIACLSPSRFLRILTRAYIEFFRGTPLLVQIFWIYFGFPALARSAGLPLKLDPLPAAVLALSLNAAAYIAEIVRGAIQSIELGQREASESLGLSAVQSMQYVIFPQAFRRMLPPLSNQFASMLKDTSLAAVISVTELFRQGQQIVARTYQAFEVYTAVAIIYLALTLLSSVLFGMLERSMNPVERANRNPKPAIASVAADGGDR